MIGFDVAPELKDLKKALLFQHKVFTGEAKPAVIRLLPSLAITKEEADLFLERLHTAVSEIRRSNYVHA
jgi:acetylornithine aminotransferase